MKIIVRPSLEDIFPNQETSISDLLINSNSDILYDLISLIIHEYDRNFNTESKQLKFLFNDVLSRCDKVIVNDIKKKIINLKKDNAEILFFNKYTCLCLLEHSIELSKKTNFVDSGETDLNIFKAFLLVNSEITKREEIAGKLLKSKSDKLTEYHVVKMMPEIDITYFHMKRESICQFIKFFIFFEYLKEYVEFSPIIQRFNDEKGISSFEDYFYKLFRLLQNGLSNYKFKISDNEADKQFINLLNDLTVKKYDTFSQTEHDFLELRKQPLIKNHKEEYIILFFPFLFNKAFNSLFFEFNELFESQQISIENGIKNFKAFYNSSYSEKKLFNEAIHLVFKNRYKQISGSSFRGSKIFNSPDYYIRNGNKVFLFENKAITISENVRTSFDIDLITKELSNKLIENEKGKKKGLHQLKNYIDLFLNNAYLKLDRNVKPLKCIIYPILVVHDNSFYTPGLNILINRWFQEIIKENNYKDKIKGLTIIHIDDLIYYSIHLTKLDSLIDKYLKFQENEKSSDSMYSFSDFLNFRNLIDDKQLNNLNDRKLKLYFTKFIE